jgi:cation:H+ antiporter
MFATLILDNVIDPTRTSDFSRQDGLVIVLVFLVFVYYLISMNRKKKTANEIKKVNEALELIDGDKTVKEIKKQEEDEKPCMKLWKALLFTAIGIIAIVIGSNIVVESASKLAGLFGVSERMIALTIVALGTSLPELVTSVIATKKGEVELAIGNVVGSNIFNIGIVAGLPIAIFGGIAHVSFSLLDLSVMVFSAIMLFFFARDDRRISRLEGGILLSIFVAYYIYVVISGLGIV